MNSVKTLSAQHFRLALQLVGRQQALSDQYYREHYGDTEIDALVQTGLLTLSHHQRHWAYQDQLYPVHWNPNQQYYEISIPDLNPIVLPTSAVRQYQFNQTLWRQSLADAFGISHPETPLIDQQLWDLGHAAIKDHTIQLWLGTWVSPQPLNALIHRLPTTQPRVILTPFQSFNALPQHHTSCSIAQLLIPESQPWTLDFDRLQSQLTGQSFESGHVSSVVQYDEDDGILVIHDNTFCFDGVIQRKIITLLYEAYLKGKPNRLISTVLEEAGSGSGKLSSVFNPSSNWKEAIGFHRGRCWLRVKELAPHS